MTHPIFTSEFSIYKMNHSENLYIAIPQAFTRIIRQYVMEYQGLPLVPADKKVSGITFNDYCTHKSNVEIGKHITDVSINQLAFGNF